MIDIDFEEEEDNDQGKSVNNRIISESSSKIIEKYSMWGEN